MQPERVWCRSFPTRTEIKILLAEMRQKRVGEATNQLFTRLSRLPPPLRLAFNLRTYFGAAVSKPVENVLVEGLSDSERKALLELDSSGVPMTVRETAHGLLNIHERWIAKRALGKKFEEAHQAIHNRLDTKPLDNVLGDEPEI